MGQITLTREAYKAAVEKAQREFSDKLTERDEDATGKLVNFMMGIQNLTFAIMLEEVLFGE